MTTMKSIAAILSVCLLAGCGTLGPKLGSTVADQIDLGDGMVFGIVPISEAASAVNKAAPGGGAVVDALGEHFAKQRQAKYGPFNGLQYTTERQVVLKTGKVIPQSEIDRIVEILSPIVPGPIVRVVEPQRMSYETVSGTSVPNGTNTPPATPRPAEGPAITPEDQAALDLLESKD
ncbi:MAG: hypothetical protein E6R03_16175 [Hyphomicrobiaceae bacterium]|nr:MAG: hypothetical protein E6R03_16175 [Hyphomicrobiaceae bacterium]